MTPFTNKTIVLLLALCWFIGLAPLRAQPAALQAQSAAPDSLRQFLDHVFAPLDKSLVPTPFLEEYGRRYLPLDVFNGTLTDSSLTTIRAFRLAYATVGTGGVTSQVPLPTLADLNTRLRTQEAASEAIPIVVQRIDYATLRPDALTAGLLAAQNGQLYDVPGRTQSPYQLRTLFMASPARSWTRTGDVSFVFAQNLHVQSGGGSVNKLSIDFGDGRGYLPVTWGQPIGTNYCTAGTKRVKVRVTYYQSIKAGLATHDADTTGMQPQVLPGIYTSYESHFDLEVQAPGCAPNARYSDPQRVITFGPTSQHSGGKVYIRYGDVNRTQLLRPLIVAEGYDISAIAPHLQTNYGIADFLSDINPQFGYKLYNDLQAAARPNGLPNGATGYDIVFIDYADGTDDIRRNAALFQEVVARVNQEKAANGSSEKNVVLGISMGGLVARYGLAQMERATPNSSDTRLLITQDSPHRGANTPLGLQALTRQGYATIAAQILSGLNVAWSLVGADVAPELFEANALLDAPATQQLLLVRALELGAGPAAYFWSQANTFINNDYQPMVSGTFPYRFVATSLGSQCATGSLSPTTNCCASATPAFFHRCPGLCATLTPPR
jgi:hypothetical protein